MNHYKLLAISFFVFSIDAMQQPATTADAPSAVEKVRSLEKQLGTQAAVCQISAECIQSKNYQAMIDVMDTFGYLSNIVYEINQEQDTEAFGVLLDHLKTYKRVDELKSCSYWALTIMRKRVPTRHIECVRELCKAKTPKPFLELFTSSWSRSNR